VEGDNATTIYAPNMLIAFIYNTEETTQATQYVSVEVVDVQVPLTPINKPFTWL